MNVFKRYALFGVLFVLAVSTLYAQEDKIERILAKYGLDKRKKSSPVTKVPTVLSNAGDLAAAPSKEELQKIAQVGKELERQVERVDDVKLERLKEERNDSDTEKLEELKNDAVEENPSFFKRLFNYVPGIMKMVSAVTEFNKKAADNLARFKITFKNVSESLASFEESAILVPQKDQNNRYVFDKQTKAVKWKLLSNKDFSKEDIKALKRECLYIIIKEMVDGFNHLDPVVGNGITALSYLAPNASKQSKLVYEIATKFLPMLEKIAKENLDSSTEKAIK